MLDYRYKAPRFSLSRFRWAFIFAVVALLLATLGLGAGWKSEAKINRTALLLNAQSDQLWTDATDERLLNQVASDQTSPKTYRVLALNQALFDRTVSEAPLEFGAEAERTKTTLSLPLPDGRLWRFQIVESPVLSAELASKFPQIKTYSGQSIDNPTATVRFSWTPKGLSAFVISEQGSFVVAPFGDDREHYLSYFTHDIKPKPFECLTGTDASASVLPAEPIQTNASVASGSLRRYRLAVTVTPEFIFAVGGETVAGPGTVTAVTNYVNNVRSIYEREIGVSFNLVAVWNPAAFGVTLINGDLNQMDQQNQFFLDHLFVNGFAGSASYDVGFALGFDPRIPSGQVSNIGSPCQPDIKATGAAMVGGPSTNDYWGTAVILHELGHMFGAVHTFTPVTSTDCVKQADPRGMVEPGSGSTIMSYAGICGSDRLATGESNSAANEYFHIHSLLRIRDYKTAGGFCGQTITTNNAAPVIVNPGTGGTIPAFTPFTLTAAATDPNGDAITYAWEEYDPGVTLFRTYTPSSNGSRTFPSWTYILNNGNAPPLFVNGFFSGETLPSVSGTLNFTVTVRDNRSGGGGTTARDQLLTVNVAGTAGPFKVTQPNSLVTLTGGSPTTVSWNVANTNLAPISTSAVRILLSTDGGITFPTILVNSTPNDGSEVVTLPNTPTNAARIKIEAVGNIYFDVSDTNFAISNNGLPNLTPYQPLNWSDKIVVSTSSSNNTDSATLRPSDTLFVDWAAINNGTAATSATFATRLFVDGVERNNWISNPPLNANFFAFVQDYSIGSLSAGSHTIRLVVDATGVITESNESDNEYTKTILVSADSSNVQLSAANYSANENSGGVTVNVLRTGNLANSASVNYKTSDIAGLQSCTLANSRGSERCDYVTSVGTVRFAAGESSKTLSIPVIDDVLVEGNETFTITLSNAAGATIGAPETASLTILDNDFVQPISNPIDGVELFIRQQYLDILNRPPDSTGLQNWINTLAPCPNGGFGEPPSSNCDRLHVAAGFFQSDEFLNRGYWAFRFYMVTQNQRPTYAQFIPDMAQVGGPKSPVDEEASKVAFANAFVQRPEFQGRYGGLSGQGLANALLLTAGLPSSTFTVSGNMTNGQILRGVVETTAVLNRFLTEGTVSIQYFGFLRRDPDTIGYQNNVNTLNANPNNLRHMIFIFIYSSEYRSRFGPP